MKINDVKKKMKIGIVVDQLLAGGVQLAAIEQVKQLRVLGHEATLIILMRKKYATDFSYLVRKVPHFFLSDSYPRFFKTTFKLPLFSFLSTLHLASPFFAQKVIKRNEYDVLISWGTTTCLTTQSLFRYCGIPYVAIIHDPIEYILNKVYSQTLLKLLFPLLIPISRLFERSFIRDALDTIIISSVHQTYIQRQYRVKPHIIPLGITVPRYVVSGSGKKILSFGRWQKNKSPEFLLKILKQLPQSQLIIAGSWISNTELAWFRNKVKKEHLTNRIEIIPHYTHDELIKLAQKSFVWIHPHFEAFGLAALEAASLGLPIIIPKHSGVTEKFKHGVHGYFPHSLTEYPQYIHKLSQNPALAKRLGNAARLIVRKQYSWKNNVDNLFHLISESSRKKIVVLEMCHVLGNTLSGGDKLMEPMTKYLSSFYNFTIVVSHLGAHHWREAKFTKHISVIAKNVFDRSSRPVPIFISYMIRIIKTSLILRKHSYNCLYSSTNLLPDVFPAYFSKRLHHIWIARIHHLIPPPHKRPGSFLVNFVSYCMQQFTLALIRKKADSIIALNEQLRKQLIEANFRPEKLQVVGGGINRKRIQKQTIFETIPRYQGIFVGRLHPTKGIFDLVPIWKAVTAQMPLAKLAIIGSGSNDFRKRLRTQIENFNMTDRIEILGYVSEKKLIMLLKRAKIFLFTDHEAGWGLAVAEAMAAGLPVVGYDIGILKHVFKKGFQIVPQGDTMAFAQTIVAILQNKTLRRNLIHAAHSESKKFDWEITSTKFTSVVHQLFKTHRLSPTTA